MISQINNKRLTLKSYVNEPIKGIENGASKKQAR